jgi:transcriptional regulator with XRE-family HTH domain
MGRPDTTDGVGEFTEGASIGSKIREWRKERALTLEALARAVGLSTGYVSQVERGLANPSLETLKRLADAVGHTVGELFSESEDRQDAGYSISKRGQRKKIQYPGSGIMNELLSPDLHHQMEVIWVEAPPGASSGGHPHAHQGEECGIVIKGQMIFWVGPDQVVLNEGDSIYLDSTIPHRWTAGDKGELHAVWLITPPTF